MADRTLSNVTARPENGEVPDPTNQGRRRVGNTGRVQLDGTADWMARGDLVRASLTPSQARQLAASLLIAAERAEGLHVSRH